MEATLGLVVQGVGQGLAVHLALVRQVKGLPVNPSLLTTVEVAVVLRRLVELTGPDRVVTAWKRLSMERQPILLVVGHMEAVGPQGDLVGGAHKHNLVLRILEAEPEGV
jgi:hypothetical protein